MSEISKQEHDEYLGRQEPDFRAIAEELAKALAEHDDPHYMTIESLKTIIGSEDLRRAHYELMDIRRAALDHATKAGLLP